MYMKPGLAMHCTTSEALGPICVTSNNKRFDDNLCLNYLRSGPWTCDETRGEYFDYIGPTKLVEWDE